jgi:hydroxymethylpyrimidine pyrophosphatase-like HAD family hydrolase
MMSDITLIATDLDGTLFNNNGTLTSETTAVLKRAVQRGIRVVFATMRVPGRVIPFCRALDLHDPIICLNGALVLGTPDGPTWANPCFPQAIALVIAQVADDHGWGLGITIGEMTYWRQRPGQTPGPLNSYMSVVAANVEAVTGDLARIHWRSAAIAHIRVSDPPRIGATWKIIIMGMFRGPQHLRAPGDKGAALALVLTAWRPSDQVMACGDTPAIWLYLICTGHGCGW